MSINKVILIGNLGKDPEIRHTTGGQTVACFSLATTEKYTDRNGDKQENTEWHNIVVWGKLAELVERYLNKGRQVYLEGKLTTSSWEDQNSGGTKYRTEIVAKSIEFLGGSDQRRSNHNEQYERNGHGNRQESNQDGGYREQRPQQNNRYQEQSNQFDDDIPW